jgi:hypothetical protein
MRAFAAIILVALVGCAAPKRGDLLGAPFTFIGIPRVLSEQTFQDIDGLQRGLLVEVVRVTKGRLDEPQIEFPIRADQPSPLKIGVRYLITAGYGQHGRVILEYHEVK